MEFIGMPADEEYDFVSYFDKNIDPNDIYNNIMDYDYLQDRGYLGHIKFLHMIINEKEPFYWIHAINIVWDKYCRFRDDINRYEMLMDPTKIKT